MPLKQFKKFEENECKANRKVTGKWSWLAPPLSPSLVHNYHKGYDNEMRSPNFYIDKINKVVQCIRKEVIYEVILFRTIRYIFTYGST